MRRLISPNYLPNDLSKVYKVEFEGLGGINYGSEGSIRKFKMNSTFGLVILKRMISHDEQIRNQFFKFMKSFFKIYWNSPYFQYMEERISNSTYFIETYRINTEKVLESGHWSEDDKTYEQDKADRDLELIELMKTMIGGESDGISEDLNGLRLYLERECPIIAEYYGSGIGTFWSMYFLMITRRGDGIYFEQIAED
ncbi:predicted protein [Naegleria gruberi]|uniref:Predicted protein n=1 Tax=Naegleria gruberi TaxID=5762 RepID=D2VUI6_NAEGR|nr:uncharacterized protein NAEGRDRAFT_52361 [Naegleria gruberi]EFC39519.1 predicted protein [Naegleria gruberi]|eukprot:XP_002672263.1 predicted protein [Naegleria gruberi strain NEG-M]